MLRFHTSLRLMKSHLGRVIFFSLVLLCLLGGWMASSTLHARSKATTSAKASASANIQGKAEAQPTAPATVANSSAMPSPDTLLEGIYTDISGGHLRSALAKANRLVDAYPNFHLGQLIRGDLLLMHARPVTALGDVANANASKLQELRAEAIARLKMLQQAPDPDLIPRAFIQLRPEQKYALLVDANNSRLFVYQNKNGKLSLLKHVYISHGKLGVNKVREGDQKTPIGIYQITSRIAKEKLPDFYGAGALPLNYPNEWDRLHDRSGSGIWLHGMPSTSFSRPPLASDGCVALNNPDMSKLINTVDIGRTPVIISDQVEWVNATIQNRDRKTAQRMLEQWRHDVENGDLQLLARNYSANFKPDSNDNLSTWLSRQYPPVADPNVSVKLLDLSLFRYPGDDNLIVASFTQTTQSGKKTISSRKRQYWTKESGKWKIVYETKP